MFQIFIIERHGTEYHAVLWGMRRQKIDQALIVVLIVLMHPFTRDDDRRFVFFLHDPNAGRHVGCFQGKPRRHHVDGILRARAELWILVAGRLRAADHQVVLLVVQKGIRQFGMLRQNVLELRLNHGVVLIGTGEFLADRGDQVVGFVHGFLFGDRQHVGEVALDSRFDGLRALDMLQVPNAEGHQGRRWKRDGQLQGQKRSGAVR